MTWHDIGDEQEILTLVLQLLPLLEASDPLLYSNDHQMPPLPADDHQDDF